MRSLVISANAYMDYSISCLIKLSMCIVRKSVPSFALIEVVTNWKEKK